VETDAKMGAEEKDEYHKNVKEQEENQAKANKLIDEAREKLRLIKIETDEAIKEVEDLKKANIDK